MKWMLACLILVAVGCKCPDKAILRESMYQGVRTERQLAKNTADKLVVDPVTGHDHRDQLQSMSQQQHDNLFKADQEFEDLVVKDRAND